MEIASNPEWQQLVLYAAGAALLLILVFNIPYVVRVVRALLSFALLAFCIFLLLRQAPFDPNLARLTERLGLDDQQMAS